MIENLKKLYKDAFLTAEIPIHTDNYSWFLTETGTYFGIKLERLTAQEISLLSSLFTPYGGKHDQEMSDKQAYWYNLLFLNQGTFSIDQHHHSHCRFIHFYANQPITDKSEFQEAVQALLPIDTIFLWESDSNGILIEMRNDDPIQDESFDEITVTLTSDFYADFHLFIGQVYPFSEELHHFFKNEKKWFQKALQYLPKQKVYYPYDVMPFELLESMEPAFRTQLINVIPHDLQFDHELLETIKVFIESDLNVSNAAKRLYMHRNSLQYRIEKFIEKTGVDIKHFQGAVITYLAILSLNHFSDS